MSLMETLQAAFRSGNPGEVAKTIPYFGFLGLTFSADAEGKLQYVILPYSERNIGNPTLPALHGGAIGAFLECAALSSLIAEQELSRLPKIINITVDYLRLGRPEVTYAYGLVTRRGRRVANVRAEAWQGSREQPIASANAHFLIG